MEEIRLELAKILLSAVLSYAALFLCAKLIGRKQIAQLNFLDYIAGITIGSIAAELATDLENMWMGENLRRMGVDAAWLDKQLRAQGIRDAKEVYLGLCDTQKKLTVYRMECETA